VNTPALTLARLALAALTPDERRALMAESAPKSERILSRDDVATRFNRTTRAVDGWAKRGLLHKVKLPGSSRAVGFRLSEIEALLAGNVK